MQAGKQFNMRLGDEELALLENLARRLGRNKTQTVCLLLRMGDSFTQPQPDKPAPMVAQILSTGDLLAIYRQGGPT